MDVSLLDTDTLIELLKQKNPFVAQHAVAYLQQYGQFAFSAMSRYEALRGIKEKNALVQLQRFSVFSQHSLILAVSDSILDRAVDLWVAARRAGQSANDADLIIAATASEFGRTLVTGNTQHFSWINGLKITDWRQP